MEEENSGVVSVVKLSVSRTAASKPDMRVKPPLGQALNVQLLIYGGKGKILPQRRSVRNTSIGIITFKVQCN